MEIWKDVAGYEGLYQVSNFGRVKSLERKVKQGKYGNLRVVAEKVLRVSDNGNGYLQVCLRRNNKREQRYIHRLVAQHFVENKNQGCNVVNHKDHDTKNNKASNLEWVTQKDNVLYSVERMKKPRTVIRTATGHKYIYMRDGRYRVCLPHHSERSFANLPDALAYKGVVLDER
jgi:hypothetical protein